MQRCHKQGSYFWFALPQNLSLHLEDAREDLEQAQYGNRRDWSQNWLRSAWHRIETTTTKIGHDLLFFEHGDLIRILGLWKVP